MATSNRAPGRGRLAAFVLLVVPLAVYTVLYLIPIGSIASLSVDNGQLAHNLANLRNADDEDPDALAAALLLDMAAMDRRAQGIAARQLNQEEPGFRSLFIDTARDLDEIEPTAAGLTAFDARWAEPQYWEVLDRNAERFTPRHFQKVFGVAGKSAPGELSAERDDIYLQIMGRTLWMAFQITLLTILIGYPLAYAVANGTKLLSRVVLMAILLSFWTSILVRTTAWIILLQTTGVINTALLSFDIISEPLQLIFNRFGAVVSITHVLLPFAIIPMMNVMRSIPHSQQDASRSLGAGPIETFLRVYLPQSMRGVLVGGATVFLLSLGFYITPALTGGPSDQMLSYYIAYFVQQSLNWGMASALSVMLLAAVLILVLMFGATRWTVTRRRGYS